MAVVNVEVPDNIAKKFTPYSLVNIEDFKEEIYDEDDLYTRIIDFWPNWLWKQEWEEYLKTK